MDRKNTLSWMKLIKYFMFLCCRPDIYFQNYHLWKAMVQSLKISNSVILRNIHLTRNFLQEVQLQRQIEVFEKLPGQMSNKFTDQKLFTVSQSMLSYISNFLLWVVPTLSLPTARSCIQFIIAFKSWFHQAFSSIFIVQFSWFIMNKALVQLEQQPEFWTIDPRTWAWILPCSRAV